MTIDFVVEIEQSDNQKFKMEISLEGAFLSEEGVTEKAFKQLVEVNGAAAIIGKIVIPFVNVIDYYKSLAE